MLRLAAVTACYADLRHKESTAHSLSYVALLRPFNLHGLLKNFENWLKEKIFELRLQLKLTDPLFVDWDYVDFFDIPPVRRCESFVKVPEGWEYYEYSCLLRAVTPVVFGGYSNLLLSNDHNNLFLRVAVAEYSVFCLISFVSSALYGESCITSGDFHGVKNFFRGGILFPSSRGVLDFVQDVDLVEVVRGCTFDIPQTYLELCRNCRG